MTTMVMRMTMTLDTMTMAIVMMALVVMRMMLLTEWDANGRGSTMDKGCGCVKTCFDDRLPACQ